MECGLHLYILECCVYVWDGEGYSSCSSLLYRSLVPCLISAKPFGLKVFISLEPSCVTECSYDWGNSKLLTCQDLYQLVHFFMQLYSSSINFTTLYHVVSFYYNFHLASLTSMPKNIQNGSSIFL